MTTGVDIASLASLVGDPGRANMLALLIDGRAHTATELATAAGVTRATASGHLARLKDGRLIAAAKQGRHRYFRLASPQVAAMLESLMVLAGDPSTAASRATPRVPKALRLARSCYDHLAGSAGVALMDALVVKGAIAIRGEDATLTAEGEALFTRLGIIVPPAVRGGRPVCRICLDWSERRPHLAGAVGAALLKHALQKGWLERTRESRALGVSLGGATCLVQAFGVDPRTFVDG